MRHTDEEWIALFRAAKTDEEVRRIAQGWNADTWDRKVAAYIDRIRRRVD